MLKGVFLISCFHWFFFIAYAQSQAASVKALSLHVSQGPTANSTPLIIKASSVIVPYLQVYYYCTQ
jgi:hypothetical protein